MPGRQRSGRTTPLAPFTPYLPHTPKDTHPHAHLHPPTHATTHTRTHPHTHPPTHPPTHTRHPERTRSGGDGGDRPPGVFSPPPHLFFLTHSFLSHSPSLPLFRPPPPCPPASGAAGWGGSAAACRLQTVVGGERRERGECVRSRDVGREERKDKGTKTGKRGGGERGEERRGEERREGGREGPPSTPRTLYTTIGDFPPSSPAGYSMAVILPAHPFCLALYTRMLRKGGGGGGRERERERERRGVSGVSLRLPPARAPTFLSLSLLRPPRRAAKTLTRPSGPSFVGWRSRWRLSWPFCSERDCVFWDSVSFPFLSGPFSRARAPAAAGPRSSFLRPARGSCPARCLPRMPSRGRLEVPLRPIVN